MKNKATAIKRFLTRHLNIYRAVTAIGFIITATLVLLTPVQMPDPDDWAYYFAARNFSNGDFTIDNYTEFQQAREAGQHGGVLLQYLPVAKNKWALEKAPGYVFYLVPFEKLGLPRWGNILLALGMVIVAYIFLKRLRDEKTAMLGSLLLLFTPIGLIMLNRAYMDTYASLAFLAMGGGLYFCHHLERGKLPPLKSGILLFLAFFFISWSVVARYTNVPVAVMLALHLAITRIVAWRKKQKTRIKLEILPVILGIGIPLAGMLVYDYFVFGSPFKYGYSITPYPINFAFQYLGQADTNGVSIPLQIIQYNLQGAARNIWIGFPLLIIGIPAFIAVLYQKCGARFKWRPSKEKWAALRSELPWDILLMLTGWFVFVFGLYLMYEWTAGIKQGGGFVIFDRFMLPGLFPVAVICALIMARFPYKVLIPVMAIIIVFGVVLYAQWAWDLHVLPDWLTVRTLEGRWYGYGFPPWTESGVQFYKYFYPGK